MTEGTSQINPGQVIDGKYRIVRLLGTGGMGAVYEGENVRIRRKVAIKMLHLSVSTQADVVRRFEREAQASALVGSEHICEVLDLGVLPDGTRYMVMEYLDGETLSGRIQRNGRLVPQQTIPLLLQILEALGAAHQAGIIHRDLKPDNIFILPQRAGMKDFIKILDFGVSKFAQTGGEEMNATRAGAVVGTPYYMSPEQARGSSAIDARTDVYAIGVLLFQATTGQVPYQAETFNELLFKIVLEVPPPPQTYVPDLDPEFAGIILKAMAREPDQRFQSCAEFAAAIRAFQTARANGIPAPLAPPQGPRPAATQMLDVGPLGGGPPLHSHSPTPAQPAHSPSWPATTPADPTLPLQASPVHPSGPSWAQGSGANAAAAAQVTSGSPATTGASWGNASSATPPRSRAPMILGVLAAIAIVGGGASAAFFAFGKPKPAPATPGIVEATPTSPAIAAPSVTVDPTPTTAPIVTASAAADSAAPAASAKPVASVAPVSVKPVRPGSKPPVAPAVPATPKPPKPPSKPPGDLGY